MLITLCSAVIFALTPLSVCELKIEPPVELRWDFTSCGVEGRFGPEQEECDDTYQGTNLDGDVMTKYGIQKWTVPVSGLYLISARGPSGLSVGGKYSGQGAVTTGDFRLRQGEELNILIGQKSDYDPAAGRNRGPGGSGGTFVTRVSDGYVLMVAGGGTASAGNIPDENKRNHADANTDINGKNASKTNGGFGLGGVHGNGGFRGFPVGNQISTSGGGAGYYSNGNFSYIKPGELLEVESPSPSIFYKSRGVSDNAPGVGGFFMFFNAKTVESNGGFGGGGSGSFDGGAGGGGGYSGGGGGAWNGWGGGGGSILNGERPQAIIHHQGAGSVTITFIGHSCCGPIVVYIAMCLVAGIIVTVLLIYFTYRIFKWSKNQKSDKIEESSKESCWTKAKNLFHSLFNSPEKSNKSVDLIAPGQRNANIYANDNANDFSSLPPDVLHGRDYDYSGHGDNGYNGRDRDSGVRGHKDSKKSYAKTRKRDYDHSDYDRSRRRNIENSSIINKT